MTVIPHNRFREVYVKRAKANFITEINIRKDELIRDIAKALKMSIPEVSRMWNAE